MKAYVVESVVRGVGVHPATARVYVATEARAIEIASGAPGRTWREVDVADMPVQARENLERASRERS